MPACLVSRWSAALLRGFSILMVSACVSGSDPSSSPDAVAEAPSSAGPFDWTIGIWKGHRKGFANDSREPMQMIVRPVLAGAGQWRELEITLDGGAYRGVAVQVLDTKLDCWVRQYVNGSRGTFARLECELHDKHSVWRSATPGRTRESKLVSKRVSLDHWVRTMSISEDGGETWRPIWEDELAREQE